MEFVNGFTLIIGTLGEFIKNATVAIIFVTLIVKNEWLANIVKYFKEIRLKVAGVTLETISIDKMKDEFLSIEEDIKRLTNDRPMGGSSPYLTYRERVEIVNKLLVFQTFGVNLVESNNSNLLMLMGNYHYHCHEYTSAVKYFKKATLLEDDASSAYCNLGWASIRQGSHLDAISYFKRAKEKDAINAHALLGLAIASIWKIKNQASLSECFRMQLRFLKIG